VIWVSPNPGQTDDTLMGVSSRTFATAMVMLFTAAFGLR
jgi:hypothetical protein